MDESGVLDRLEELQILLEDAKPCLGRPNLRQVNTDEALDILDEIHDIFPSEFAQARQIMREREALIDDAEAQAARIIEDAKNQALTVASEQEIVRIAQKESESIMQEAREIERETRAGAEDYADEVFGHVEQTLENVLSQVQRVRDRLNATSTVPKQ